MLFGLLGLSLEKERYFSLVKFDSTLRDRICSQNAVRTHQFDIVAVSSF